jgi:putative addiction module component (TIGR02574 family)
MANTYETLMQQALSLNARDRRRLATELLDSVETGTGADIELTWEEEIKRRMAEVEAGTTTKGRPWDEINRDFDSRYGR